MRLLVTGIFLAGVLPAIAVGTELPDIERGRALYENHCEVCHSSKVHRRINRLPLDIRELRQIVDNWQKEENLHWGAQDVEDVVQFLNQTRYKF